MLQIVQFGRLTDDRVQRIQWDYNKHGHVELISSFGAKQKLLNQVRRRYNELGMVENDSQDHFGTSSSALEVTLTNETFNGEPRPGVLSYPGVILTADEQSDGFSGRQQRHLSYHYHGTGPANGPLGRIGAIEYYASEGVLNGHMEAQYKYGGLADINELRYSFPDIWTNLGDYDALDAHGRVASYFWRDGFSVHEKIKYAYDRVHNRMARLNEDILVTDRDEAYQYDKLTRLSSFQRGALPRASQGSDLVFGFDDTRKNVCR